MTDADCAGREGRVPLVCRRNICVHPSPADTAGVPATATAPTPPFPARDGAIATSWPEDFSCEVCVNVVQDALSRADLGGTVLFNKDVADFTYALAAACAVYEAVLPKSGEPVCDYLLPHASRLSAVSDEEPTARARCAQAGLCPGAGEAASPPGEHARRPASRRSVSA